MVQHSHVLQENTYNRIILQKFAYTIFIWYVQYYLKLSKYISQRLLVFNTKIHLN